MPSIDVNNAPVTDWSQGELDLGPLAWVLDELRKSLDGAVKAMRRFVRDAEVARESDLAALDAGSLRIARQQLHQACGALEMVGMGPPALVLRAMESAVQKFVQRPESCSDEAAAVIERASFALIEYLEAVLAGKATSPVALFPQYREAQALAGADRVHPADLWPVERRFREPAGTITASPLPYGPEARARLDTAVLRIVKSADKEAARSLRDVSLSFVAAQQDRQSRAFWKISAGFFEAFAEGILPPDVYVKRVASRVLLQYASLAKGDTAITNRLVQDLLFFCAQARPEDPGAENVASLQAVRQAYSLERFKPVDYETARFGRFDPALLAQARKRIAAATETWSALAGGDRNKLKPAADQFSLVCDSLRKLHPSSEPLAQALTNTLESTARSGEPPSASLAMEVATSVLYLQAAFEELDADDDQMQVRAVRLAERLKAVNAGAEPEPLEAWMEELYRRVSDNQTMGSVVDELRSTLGEVEKSLDQYFRDSQDTAVLATVPGHMAQMRGVLSVLGLDQASLAVVRMRDLVERLLLNEVPQEDRQSVFEKLGNSFGALGFLIDMLSYQRAMARKLFVYDEELGELRILTGKSRARATDEEQEIPVKLEERSATHVPDVLPRYPEAVELTTPTTVAVIDHGAVLVPEPESASAQPLVFPAVPELQPQPLELAPEISLSLPDADKAEQAPAAESEPAPVSGTTAASAPQAAPTIVQRALDVEDELLEVFLEEAREVVTNGLAALDVLQEEPGNLSEQTTLRRAFHTLKGSSRMVGLNDYGEAAWSMEQLLNAWLAEQKPMPPHLHTLSCDALRAFSQWADDIAQGNPGDWQPSAFRESADAMRLQGAVVPLVAKGGVSAVAIPASAEPQTLPEIDSVPAPAQALLDEPQADSLAEGVDTDFNLTDFAITEISDDEPSPEQNAQGDHSAPAASSDVIEDIDFSVFAAAMTEVPEAPVVVATSDPDFVLDLELPDLEPVDEPVAALLADPVGESLAGPQVDDALPDAPLHSEEPVHNVPEVVEVAEAVTVPEEPLDVAPEPALDVPHHAPPVLRLVGGEAFEAAAAQDDSALDDAVKVIESLRIPIPLYNVYLNEADEWSRRLATSLQEWLLELHEPLPDIAVALSHSLAGSSATVGFLALSGLARSLEHALEHVQLQSGGTQEQAQTFIAAADDIRRLLHQFAAGFLKEPSAEVQARLRQILEAEEESTQTPPLEDADAFMEAQSDLERALAELPPEPAPEPVLDWSPAVAAQPELAVHDDLDHDWQVDEAIANAVALSSDEDDDIDAIDVIDPDLFPIFEEEALELMPQLGGALRQWSARPDNLGARNEVLRALHTIKGSSRLAGAMRLGELAHRLESAIERLDAETVTSAQIDPLQGSFDSMQANFDVLRAISQLPPEPVRPLSALPETAGPVVDAVAQAKASTPSVRVAAAAQMAPQRMASNQSVRVRAQLLDRLVNQAGEVMISRSRLDVRLGQFRSSLTDLTGNLDRLRQQLRDIEVQAESQMQSRLALSKDSAAGFDPLEFDRFTRVQELTRMMAESVNDVATVQRNLQRTLEGAEDDLIAQGRQARELQRDLLHTRMVEFEGISERLYAVVRQSSKETGKQIKLDITGGSIEMDRGVLDRMTPAFEHLLRNCVAHGVEPPEVRTAAGKPATGTITIELHHEGNDVSVEFRDDGAGLNLPRILEKAQSLGMVEANAQLSDADIANLIFTPGFSTATEVTGLSGRGIGMDVVRTEINALGGRIETTTQAGQGSAFRMVLPLTTAVTQVVMLRAGELAVGVPASVVEIVRRTPDAELQEAYRTGMLDVGGEQVPFFWSGALLQASVRSVEPRAKTRPVVVFSSASQRIAMHVDEVLGNQEVVVKNLGPQLSRLPGLSGMSVLASGAVVLIYNPVALATVYGDQVRALTAGLLLQDDGTQATDESGAAKALISPQLAGTSQVPLVLVVDDSITVRRVTQRLLQREGYRVALAADGLQALERLQEERPTVVLSDIEMPRMDGFDLARNIRADRALQGLPIIMITSRIAEKHREHAMELGVNNYLGKPYSDEELLSLIQHYVRLASAAHV